MQVGLQPPLCSYTKEAITTSSIAGAVITWKRSPARASCPCLMKHNFTVTCRDCVSFPSFATCCVSTFPFVSIMRCAITTPSLQGAVITRETVSRSGTTTSLTGATVICVPRRPDRWVSELNVYMAGGPVVMYPAVGYQAFHW